LQELHDAFWGERYGIIEDPDRIAAGVMSPVSSDKKPPPAGCVIAGLSPGARDGLPAEFTPHFSMADLTEP
jgi:hypothetical protein